jgi:hypothetical protein
LEALTCWKMLQYCLIKWFVHPYLQHNLMNLVIVVMDSNDDLILVVCYLTWPTHPITKLVFWIPNFDFWLLYTSKGILNLEFFLMPLSFLIQTSKVNLILPLCLLIFCYCHFNVQSNAQHQTIFSIPNIESLWN